MNALLRRPERDGDAALLFDLFREVHGGILAGLDPALRDALLRQQSVGQVRSYRAHHPGARFEVVEDGGIAVGRLVTDPTAGPLAVLDLCLLARHRGRGLGTRLLRGLQAEARAAGVPLRLSVQHDNARAQRLYRRVGFAPARHTATHLDMEWAP